MAHVARGAVAVIGERLHDDGDARRAVTLVDDLLVIVRAAFARGLFDDAFDIVVGHIRRLCLGNDVLQLGVARRVGTALLDRHRDLAADLGKHLCAGVIGLFLFAFDGTPFGMS